LIIKCVLIFPTTFIWNIFHSKKNRARYNQTFILVFRWSTLYVKYPLFLSDFNKT
jgi:hypothetical protein